MLRRKGQPEGKCQESVRPQWPSGESSSQCSMLRTAETNQNWKASFRLDKMIAFMDFEKSGSSGVVGKKIALENVEERKANEVLGQV